MIGFSKPYKLETLAITRRLAVSVGKILVPGDTILLWGPIGSGKTAFARALIQSRIPNAQEVPSPTYTLVQTYEDPACEIWHADLFRLSGPEDAIELGLDQAFQTEICLIEWPERLNGILPKNSLNITFSTDEVDHYATFSGSASWQNRLLNCRE